MKISFPPLQRRVISWSVGKHNRTVFIEQVNIIPLGGGVWLPVRNLTKQLRLKEAALLRAKKMYDELSESVKRERSFVEAEINRIGYFTESYVIKDPATGEYKEFDARHFVKITLGGDTPTLKKDIKLKKVTHTPLVMTTRPRTGGNNKKGKNDNSNN